MSESDAPLSGGPCSALHCDAHQLCVERQGGIFKTGAGYVISKSARTENCNCGVNLVVAFKEQFLCDLIFLSLRTKETFGRAGKHMFSAFPLTPIFPSVLPFVCSALER